MSDLSELFAKDPLSLTKEDRAQMIAHFRASRAAFMAGQRTASVTKPAKAKATGQKVTGLTIDDLLSEPAVKPTTALSLNDIMDDDDD